MRAASKDDETNLLTQLCGMLEAMPVEQRRRVMQYLINRYATGWSGAERLPLEVQRRTVAEFLRARPAGAKRSEISHMTGVRSGSLSAILLDKDVFEQIHRGYWRLKP